VKYPTPSIWEVIAIGMTYIEVHPSPTPTAGNRVTDILTTQQVGEDVKEES
jgi:hypothetical protein